MSLGDYMREKRKEKDWSQRDLANASGVSNAEISRLEAGKRKEPSIAVLEKIAKALNTPISEVLEHADLLEAGKAFVEKYADVPVSSIIASTTKSPSLTDDLTDEEIEEVKRYIDYIKSKRK